MNKLLNIKYVLPLFVLAVILAIMYLSSTFQVKAATQPGIAAFVATSSNITLPAATAISVFATSTCAARIVSTQVMPVMLTFSDITNQSPTGSFGLLQAASTTVAYDASLYGCGLVKIVGGGIGATLISVYETR